MLIFSEPDSLSAADFIANIDEDALKNVLKVYGGEKKANFLARGIVESRILFKKLNTTKELADLVSSLLGEGNTDKLGRYAHPATKTFQVRMR